MKDQKEIRNMFLETERQGTLVMIGDSSVELCPAVIQKAELVNKSDHLDGISKQTVEDGFFLMYIVECKKRDLN